MVPPPASEVPRSDSAVTLESRLGAGRYYPSRNTLIPLDESTDSFWEGSGYRVSKVKPHV